MKHMTKGAVVVRQKGQGELPEVGSTLAQVHAGVRVEFSRQHAVYFEADGATHRRISDQILLKHNIAGLYQSSLWEKNWYVVVEVIETAACTVLISGSRTAMIELEAAATVGSDSFSLAAVDAGLSIRAQREMATQIIATPGATPLLRIARFRWRYFRVHSLEGMNISDVPNQDSSELYTLDDWTPEDVAL